MIKEPNIVVVGAGPAGLSFALTMASNGYNVTVLERFNDVSTAFCGEYMGPDQLIYNDLFTDCFRSGTKTIKIALIDEKYNTLSEKSVVNKELVLMNSECMKINLMKAARSAGVEFMFNARVTGIYNDSEGFELAVVSDGLNRIHADIVIGADGSNSIVRRTLLSSANMKTLPSIRKKYYVTGYPEGEFAFYIGGPFKFGYGWAYPGELTKQGLLVNIGVGFISDYVNTSVPDLLRQLISYLESTGMTLTEAHDKGVKGNVIPYSGIVRPAGAEGVLLLGDALGTVDAVVGGGVTKALWSGALAADYINSKINNNDPNFGDWYDWVVGAPYGEAVVHAADILNIGETMYSKEPKFFNLLADALNHVDETLLHEVVSGTVRKEDIIKFMVTHPVISTRFVTAIRPLHLIHKFKSGWQE